MQRILMIDDDPAITTMLKRGLFYEGFAVDVASSGEAGLLLAHDSPPDLVMLDIILPRIDGLEVLRRLRAPDPQLPILVLTAKDTPADQVQALAAGADDYVVKPFTFAVLLARIRALLRRQQIERPTLLTFTDLKLDTISRQVHRGRREILLTALEFKLLHWFLEHPQQVVSKSILLRHVWGRDFAGSPNVVEVYVKQLRQKLEANGEPRLLHTLRGAGYVLRELPICIQPDSNCD